MKLNLSTATETLHKAGLRNAVGKDFSAVTAEQSLPPRAPEQDKSPPTTIFAMATRLAVKAALTLDEMLVNEFSPKLAAYRAGEGVEERVAHAARFEERLQQEALIIEFEPNDPAALEAMLVIADVPPAVVHATMESAYDLALAQAAGVAIVAFYPGEQGVSQVMASDPSGHLAPRLAASGPPATLVSSKKGAGRSASKAPVRMRYFGAGPTSRPAHASDLITRHLPPTPSASGWFSIAQIKRELMHALDKSAVPLGDTPTHDAAREKLYKGMIPT